MMSRERDRLFITVPNLFRCPISLDVMKSPVSLCTGVTYDRSNIQRWLETGHDTCPATMQVLSSKDFVPNLTLHRLINLWIQSSTRRPESDLSPRPSPSPSQAVSELQVATWIRKIENGSADALAEVVECMNYSEENRRFVSSVGGLLEAVAGTLTREGDLAIRESELAIRILSLVLVENGVKEKLNKIFIESNRSRFSPFVSVLQEGNSKSKVESVVVLNAISLDSESKRLVAETPRLMPALLHLLKTNQDPALADVVLSFLTDVTKTRSKKSQLVELGLVEALSKTLSNKDAAVPLVEKCLKLLSAILVCTEGRLAISEDPTCAEAIVERLMKVSKTATEDAVGVLWGMCCFLQNRRMQDKVVKCNGVTKLLVVMQSVGEGDVRRMCRDLIKVLGVVSKGSNRGGGGGVGSYETKTTHIMPC